MSREDDLSKTGYFDYLIKSGFDEKQKRKKKAPRFHPNEIIPLMFLPEDGMELKKYHGKPIFLPENRGETVVSGTGGLTERQVDIVFEVDRIREHILEGEFHNLPELNDRAVEQALDIYHRLLSLIVR